MKKIILIITILLVSIFSKAQNNVGIGTPSPLASSILDLTSTTKGLLIPRMASGERTAIMSPAKGLIVFDNTTSSFWFYNGAAWAQIVDAGGGTFVLPFTGTDASSVSFNVLNTLAGGIAIRGSASTNNANSIGVFGEATFSNTQGVGVLGKASTVSATAIKGTNIQGIAIKGTNASNSNSIAAISGESTSFSGLGIEGIANGSNAGSIGVSGESASGTGVKGYSNNVGSTAVFGSSLAGTGVKAYSFTGTALDVIGNVKISGGNTNPSQGAVLTSDATGNAVWKNNKIGFSATSTTDQSVLSNLYLKMAVNEIYDTGNDFNSSTAATDPSTFIAPVNGVYNFSARAQLSIVSFVNNVEFGQIVIFKNGSYYSASDGNQASNSAGTSQLQLSISEDLRLNAGDKITIQIRQVNSSGVAQTLDAKTFCGHLVYAD